MSDTLRLTLFPLYPGGRVIHVPVGNSVERSFYLPETAFTPSYAVNIPPKNVPDGNFSIENGRLVRGTNGSIDPNRLLSLEGTSLRQTSAPETAPDIPKVYQRQASFLTISDRNYDTLMAESEFRIPGIGLGLKVTTDGQGGVDSVAIDPGSRGVLPQISAISEDFLGANRAEISIGAVFAHASPPFGPVLPNQETAKTVSPEAVSPGLPDPASVLGSTSSPFQLNPPLNSPNNSRVQSSLPLDLSGRSNPSDISAGIFSFPRGFAGDFLAGLRQAFTPEPSQPTAAKEAVSEPVVSGEALSSLQTANSKEAPQRPNAFSTIRMDRLMDGRIPLPLQPFGNLPGASSLSPGDQNAFELTSGLNGSFPAWRPGAQPFLGMESGMPQQSSAEKGLYGGLSGEGQSGQEQSPFRQQRRRSPFS